MATPTHDELLEIVRNRFPNHDHDEHTEIATIASAVMVEPHWSARITPLLAVKIAAHRAGRPSIVDLPKVSR